MFTSTRTNAHNIQSTLQNMYSTPEMTLWMKQRHGIVYDTRKKKQLWICVYFRSRSWKQTPPPSCPLFTHAPILKRALTITVQLPVVCFLGSALLGDSPPVQTEKPPAGLRLAEASQSDKVWKESWSSSLSLSDLTLMDCFVVQRAGQVLLSYITIYGVFAQQVPFPPLP